VFRAVYWELNALVEIEFMNLAQSILEARGGTQTKLSRGNAQSIIEQEYKIRLRDLPRFEEVDEIRKIANAYKHRGGFTGLYEEMVQGGSLLFGYKETRYELDWDKTYQSIQAVKEFMKSLPGDRQEFRKARLKPEDETTKQARRKAWDYLRKSGALGHDLEPVLDEQRLADTIQSYGPGANCEAPPCVFLRKRDKIESRITERRLLRRQYGDCDGFAQVSSCDSSRDSRIIEH
jgi:hypothetical protein